MEPARFTRAVFRRVAKGNPSIQLRDVRGITKAKDVDARHKGRA
jgi:hypothetical protein